MTEEKAAKQVDGMATEMKARLIESGIQSACDELRKMTDQCKDECGSKYLREAAQQIQFRLLRKKAKDERRLRL